MSVRKLFTLIAFAGMGLSIAVASATQARVKEREPIPMESCGSVELTTGDVYQLAVGNVSCERGFEVVDEVSMAKAADQALEFVVVDGWRCSIPDFQFVHIGCGKADMGVGLYSVDKDLTGWYFGSIPERPRLHLSRESAKRFGIRSLDLVYRRDWSRADSRRFRCNKRFSMRVFRCVAQWTIGDTHASSVIRIRIVPPEDDSRVRVSGQTLQRDRSCSCSIRESIGPLVFDRSDGSLVNHPDLSGKPLAP